MRHLRKFEYFGYQQPEEMDEMEDEFDLAPEYEEEEEMEEEGDEEEMFEPMGGEMPSRFEEEEEGEDGMMGHYGQERSMSNDDRSRGKISSFNNFKKQESSCPSCNCLQCECGGGANESKKAKPDFLDLDKDGDKKESMKKAAADKKKGGKEDKKEDKKTPAKKGGLSKAQEKLPEGLKKAIKAGVRD